MKKLLILLFSILISFNSYGLFDKTVCVETDAQERGGIIYLPNKTKPFTGKNLCEYDNRQMKYKENYEDFRKVGETKYSYYENGQMKYKENYKDGVCISGC